MLRQGNSDRRAPAAVKAYARNHPHSMGEWSSDSKSHVATMDDGDFFHTERSVTVDDATTVRIVHTAADGTETVLKDGLELEAGEILDAAVMRRSALVAFLQQQVAEARDQGILFSVHLKATMMKVQDPIVFGHVVRTYYAQVWDQHGDTFRELGIAPRDGMAALESAIEDLPDEQEQQIRDDIAATYDRGPELAQVDSSRGITNLHVPSDIIIDASMPAMIRSSGQMWNRDDETEDVKAVIPDSAYADLYEVVIQDCRANGAFDPTTMGTVPNVGLMARKAEEYGSHDKTFEIDAPGTVRVVDADGTVLLEHEVDTGDIWRGCQTKDDAVRDWVKLAVTRARATGWPAVFWLDRDRAHDSELIRKLDAELPQYDTDDLTLEIMNVAEATQYTVDRVRKGENTISVTGNVLRDYLTDLFPILEVGTSAKMLSIVPLMAGGGLFETGAGGSAPKHVQQLQKENHLRWDSLGEYLALGVSLEHLADQFDIPRARVLADTLDAATTRWLEEGRSPSRKVNEPDNRAATFYLAMYWARALADQDADADLAAEFAPLAERLEADEQTIVDELGAVQGDPVDLQGYYWIDRSYADSIMRPSDTFNQALADFAG